MTISVPSNTALILDDGAMTYAPAGGGTFTYKGTVGGVARIYDSGSSTIPQGFLLAFEVSVLDKLNGNEQYDLTVEGCAAADFSGEVRGLASWPISVVDQQDIIAVSTLDPLDDTIWRYIRLSIQVSGTTPSIRIRPYDASDAGNVKSGAFLRPLSDLDEYTEIEALQIGVLTLQNLQNAIDCWLPWISGEAGGGPNNDGKYPIYDGFGHSVLLKSPAQMEAEYDDPALFGNRVWLGNDETTGLSLADRETHNLPTVGYNGAPAAVADDPGYQYNAEAIQAALNRGGVTKLPGPGKTFYLKKSLVFRPGVMTLDLNGSRLTFDNDDMFTDPDTMPDMIDDVTDLVPDTVDANYNIWRSSGGYLTLTPVGPNLIPHPRYDDVSQYYQTSTGPAGTNCTYTKGSADTAKGAYDTTFNSVTTRHLVEVFETATSQAGQSEFGARCIVDAATHSNLKGFAAAPNTRYSYAVKIRAMSGAASGLRVEAYCSDATGNGLGGGSSAGLTVAGISPSGHLFTNFITPPNTAWVTIIVTALKTTAASGPAMISFDQGFFRKIDQATDIAPNYIDDVDNDGDYAAVGIHLPDLVSYPVGDDGAYIPGSQIARYKVTFEVAEITPMGPQKYVIVTLRKGVGYGGAEPLAIRQAGIVEWETPAPGDIDAGAGGFVTFQSNNGVKIVEGSIKVTRLPDNEAILIQALTSDPTFDHAGHSIKNGFINGPNLPYSICFAYDTPGNDRSSQGACYNLQVFGFGYAREFRTQAYLINDFNCTFFGQNVGEKGVPSRNAGEQINSFGSRFSGKRVVHSNRFERRIFGGSSDYPTQHRFAETWNTLETWGHHFEGGKPDQIDQVPFVAGEAGAIRLHGGKIEFSGVGQDTPAVMPHLIRLDHKFAMADLDRVEMSYCRTSSDHLVGGVEDEGRAFISNIRGGDTKNMAPFVKDDSRHDKFGRARDCETADIELNMWVAGGARTSVYECANIKGEMATDPFGNGCLQLTKHGGHGTAAQAIIWFDAKPASFPAIRFSFLCPEDNLGTGLEPIVDRQLYFEIFGTRFLPPTNADDMVPGVYRLPSDLSDGFFGLYNHTLDTIDGMTDYVTVTASGQRADDTIFFDGYLRESDNKICAIINMTGMPNGTVLQMREFKGAAI